MTAQRAMPGAFTLLTRHGKPVQVDGGNTRNKIARNLYARCSRVKRAIQFPTWVSPGQSLIRRFYKFGPFIGVATNFLCLVAVNMRQGDVVAFVFPFVEDATDPPQGVGLGLLG